jgi:hypothetical protein
MSRQSPPLKCLVLSDLPMATMWPCALGHLRLAIRCSSTNWRMWCSRGAAQREAIQSLPRALRREGTSRPESSVVRNRVHLADDGDQAEQEARKAVGERLWRDFPNGVSLAFYGQSNDEGKRRSTEWATRRNAIGFNKNLTGKSLVFGASIEEPTNFEAVVKKSLTFLRSVRILHAPRTRNRPR